MPDKDLITDEILSSERISNYMSFAYGLSNLAMPDNPTWIWEQLRSNPWLSMAVYDDIEEKDAMVASSLDARKTNVLAKTRRILPASEKRQDIKLAEFIEETLEGYFGGTDGLRLGFDSLLHEALDSVGKGVSIGEIIYGEASDRIYIQDVKFKPQHLFSFGEGAMAAYSTATYPFPQTGPLRLRPGIFGEGLSSETPLPEKKFFVHSYRPRYGNRWGSPLLRKVFWPSWFKRAAVKQWLRHLEKGSGSVVARYNDGAQESEQLMALDAARAVNEESAVAVPKKFLMEVMQHVRQSMGSAHMDMVDSFCNNEIARVIRGQTLTSRGSEGGGSRALGEVHERVEERFTEVDAKSLMLAVNTRLVFPLTLYNFGAVKQPPVWSIDYEAGADLELMSKILERLWKMSVPISRAYVYNTFQGTQPDSEEDTLSKPTGNEPSDTEDEEDGFSEGQKKKSRGASSAKSSMQQSLKTARFQKLRPSTMPRSAK